MATVGSTGQGTIDVASIVSQLMSVERRPLTKLAQREAGIQARITAFGTIKGALSSFQSALSGLNSQATFAAVKASSSDEAQVKVSASNATSRGVHSVQVTTLASAHAVASGNFANRNTTVGTGTITIEKGTFASGAFSVNATAPAKTITIGAAQSSLAGIRDAVNASNAGVNASIVNDGSGERLVFASNDGAANSLRITVSDADTTNTNATGLSALAFDPAATAGTGRNMTEMRAAQDARAIINGITITSPNNTFGSALDGITLTAVATSATAATVKVEPDTSSIRNGVDALVKAYNELHTQLKTMTAYDPTSKQAGPLNGDSTVRAIENDVRRIIGTQIDTSGRLQSLKDIGIAFDKDGALKLDSAKLQKEIDADPSGIARLFAKAGITTDSRVAFSKATADTRFGTYDVTVSRVATQGNLAGSAAAGLTVTTGVNDTLNVTVDGIQSNLTLTARSYGSPTELATEIQSKLAGSTALKTAKVTATVTANSGVLTITSDRYGSTSSIAVSGNGAVNLFGNAPTTTAGVDIAGSIGQDAASGNGQLLTGAGAAKGLELKITSTTTGSLGTVDWFQGITARLDARITDLLGSKGSLKAKTDGLNASVKDLKKLGDNLTTRLGSIEQRYRKQFSTLDATLSSMSTTSTYLQQQLASLARNSATS